MDHNNHHQWRMMRFFFKNATIALTVLNLPIFHFLLHTFLINAAQLRYIKEAEEIMLAMQPLDLIKRVREIEQEGTGGQETEQQKQNKAVDLSKRLKDFASSLKALEEWRKRKMERARQRDLEKTGGLSSSKTS
ncbi:hypothetical protein BRARA_I05486 [Brassica rapa]|uniref:Uncharacterized protein n=1 Tax=Brassica campestris TaxID=3711 RepID=A0A397Y738_BRACM|nr:hypothetical protein BRARA_I05486 [Brassica rapa]